MKWGIFSYMILFFISISSGKAQVLNFLKGGKKNEHYNYSSYSPKKDSKKEQRETRKKINSELARSYRPPKKQTAMSREEQKEIKNSRKRLQRSRGATQQQSKKLAKRTQIESRKYVTKADKKRGKEIAYNKKNYGTKATRRASQTHRSERNIIDNDEGKSLFKFKKSS